MDASKAKLDKDMERLKDMTAETSNRVKKTDEDLKGILKKVNGKNGKTEIGGEKDGLV